MCRETITGILILSALAALTSCSGDSLETTVEEMRIAACQGDAKKFMTYWDMNAAMANGELDYMEIRKKQPGYYNDMGRVVLDWLAYPFYKLEIYPQEYIGFTETIEYITEYIYNEARKGKDSYFCTFGIESIEDGKGEVTIRSPSSKMTLRFKNDFGEWKLVHYVTMEEADVVNDIPTGEKNAVPPAPSANSKTALSEPGGESVADIFRHKDGYDFRKTRWGMTPEEVRASESSKPGQERWAADQSKHYIYYSGEIAGLKTDYVYIFTDRSLRRVFCYFTVADENPLNYIKESKRIKKLISTKYGTPLYDGTVREEEEFKGTREEAVEAFKNGGAAYLTMWATPASTILLDLDNDNGEIVLALKYWHKDETGKQIKGYKELDEKL